MKNQNVVSFRAEESLREKIDRAADELKMTRAEIVEEGFIIGFPEALKRLQARKLEEAQEMISRLQRLTLSVLARSSFCSDRQ